MSKLARNGAYRRVPGAAAAAIIEGWLARGWSGSAIGSVTGLPETTWHHIIKQKPVRADTMTAAVAAKVVAADGKIPTEGAVGAYAARRRLRALARQQFDLRTIAADTGIPYSTLAQIRCERTQRTRAVIDNTIREFYNRVCYRVGPSPAARKYAEKVGWPGRFAWDNPDDLYETPDGGDVVDPETGEGVSGRRRRYVERLALVKDMADTGESLIGACARLKLSVDAFWKWCDRHGHRDLYEKLAARSRTTENASTVARRQQAS
jgi:hypothetical protein